MFWLSLLTNRTSSWLGPCKDGKPIGNPFSGIRVGLGTSICAHERQAARVVEKRRECLQKLAGDGQVRLLQHDCGMRGDHGFCVALLVLIGGSGKRDQQAGFAGRRELRHG